ncbi:SDR family oxidoreductase [Antarctobacter sp.]|uniref:SDR family oxidoreductase n=1 Tax=Antarctobacter sp. TaxID=1872577 RepID=UPI003A917A6F
MQILITGANRGIGAALDSALVARGDTVLGTARDHPEYLPLEVTDPASQAALAQRLEGQPIDALICNAGVYLDKGQNLADGYPAQMWADTFAVNVTGVFLTVQALLPNLQLSDIPRIAIISSQMASSTRAPGGSYIYRASKAAALNLGRNLAADLKPLGIAVGIYHPGWVRTDMGGTAAEISVDEAARGLTDRIDALSIETTGCFETWDGRAHPY